MYPSSFQYIHSVSFVLGVLGGLPVRSCPILCDSVRSCAILCLVPRKGVLKNVEKDVSDVRDMSLSENTDCSLSRATITMRVRGILLLFLLFLLPWR